LPPSIPGLDRHPPFFLGSARGVPKKKGHHGFDVKEV
jgi:hypothetical protein